MRSRKNNIVPMRLARRILPFAACVVIVVAGLAVPQIRQKIPQKPQKPGGLDDAPPGEKGVNKVKIFPSFSEKKTLSLDKLESF